MNVRYLLIVFTLFLLSCSNTEHNSDVLTQVNSFDLLMQGSYDGNWPYDEVLKNGNFGVGSFDHLNGEMVLLDGHLFRIEAEGEAVETGSDETACIATVCNFKEDFSFTVKDITLDELKKTIFYRLPDSTLFYAIRIEGTFNNITTRSIYSQSKPYRPLTEVIKEEIRRESSNVDGTGVGFWAPTHIQGAVWKGYHFHFLSDDHSFGGHILNFEIRNAIVKIDILNQFNLIL